MLLLMSWVKTLSSLAFDVCSLEHTQQLPEYLLHRLKNHGEYQYAIMKLLLPLYSLGLAVRLIFLIKKKLQLHIVNLLLLT